MRLLSIIQGVIRRRLLINFRADPEVVQHLLPAGFTPKLHRGEAIVGICLIRLEEIRPKGMPAVLGISSENAAHRIAVTWKDADDTPGEGVFIPRRDTDSVLNALAGGRIFPSEHHLSEFNVQDDGRSVSLSVDSRDHCATLSVNAREAAELPAGSIFSSLVESSRFFEGGSVGFSPTRDPDRFDGIALKVDRWEVRPLEVCEVRSNFFEEDVRFPKGSVQFDHGLIMRDVVHEWHGVPDFTLCPAV